MATLPLFLDTVNRRLVASATSAAPFTLPTFTRGDALTLRVTLLTPNETLVNPFALANVSNLTIRAGIGAAGLASALLTLQISWLRDNASSTFTGALPLNTPEIEAAFVASNGAALKSLFEIEIDADGDKTTALQIGASIVEDVIKDGALEPDCFHAGNRTSVLAGERKPAGGRSPEGWRGGAPSGGSPPGARS